MSASSPSAAASPEPAPKLTPMLQQYFEVRRGLPKDTLLLFRLGDFYELFFDDAIDASRLLGLTLTKRGDHPMAGLPFHAADGYVNKLLAAGRKVAICDQAEPAVAGKLVRRALTRILSPGTTLDAKQLDASRNHYLAALHADRAGLHAAWLDLSTGDFRLASDPRPEDLLPVLTALDPRELVLPEGLLDKWRSAPHEQTALHALAAFAAGRTLTELPAFQFEPATGLRAVLSTLGVLNLEGFGIPQDHTALGPAGALVLYVTENLCAKPENLHRLQLHRSAATLLLDPATLRNLEIFSSTRGERTGSLLSALSRTRTAPGARLLEAWLAAPPQDLDEIRRRSSAVGALLSAPGPLADLRSALANVRDIPRILGRLQNRLRNPRELGGIRDTLRQLPDLRLALESFDAPLHPFLAELRDFASLRLILDNALADELPADLADGNLIRPGHDAELDRLHALKTGNRAWLSELEAAEQARTGIRSLKVKFTNNFGYYIEITKANLHLVPADYIRRQTTVNGERYVTDALRQKEKEILSADDNALAREHTLFAELVAAVLDDSLALAKTANALAELDVLAGWAELAREWDYCQPEFVDDAVLEITAGRHPVVEQMLRDPSRPAGSQAFVPNDTRLSATADQLALLTGPNMAGKSTYIRQIALIALMAHVGSWVPATTCRLGLVDRIFSRVGASDDLARGNSTFMVEMNETANILNHATDRSLIILDEIGRGTSTYDGLSIAWAVVEHLHADPERGPRTLFATHYQELTQLEKHLSRLRNYSVAVKEWNDDIVFLRRVIPGPAERSFGIQVARLAGLPPSVIDRARAILAKLEGDETAVELPSSPVAKPKKKLTVAPADTAQLELL
ncbi:DNA mismatch repair protein MutS [Verrucomicrobia bacterium IMCC26134]|nr:DNA mismatch repair protein MutS [Verrucomicrobia bacterium IMCC26134]